MELLETYLQEIKQENRMLEDRFANTGTTEPAAEKKTKQKTKTNQEKDNILLPDLALKNINDTFETSMQARILELYKKGFSYEHIASTIHCGKTEVELAIKIHEKTYINA